jgi:hypothetical protein
MGYEVINMIKMNEKCKKCKGTLKIDKDFYCEGWDGRLINRKLIDHKYGCKFLRGKGHEGKN